MRNMRDPSMHAVRSGRGWPGKGARPRLCPLNTSLIAYAGMENQLKVAVELQEGEKSTKKIWRFNADLAAEYTKIQMEKEKIRKGPKRREESHSAASFSI